MTGPNRQHTRPTPETATPAPTEAAPESTVETALPDLLRQFAAPTVPRQRQAIAQQLAHQLGNRRFSQLIQRQAAPTDAGVPAGVQTPAPAPGATPNPAAPTPRDDPQIRAERERFMQTTFVASPTNFDLEYRSNPGQRPENTPILGAVKVTLKVHITFRHFTRQMMAGEDFRRHRFTREQLADFRWKPEEETQFREGFVNSVQTIWSTGSTRLNFACTSPGFDDFSAPLQVQVQVVDDPAQAHNRITAQKVPRGAPRFRSFVQGSESTLDWRDPTEIETNRTTTPERHFRVSPFATGSADLAPVQGVLDGTVIPGLRQWQAEVPAGQRGGTTFGPNRTLVIVGRADSTGGARNNERIGQQRAEAVANYIRSQLSFTGTMQALSRGSAGTGEGDEFKRVDVNAIDDRTSGQQVQQNVAAHEAGHMFGLGDEYVDPGDQRLLGDRPTHFGDVEAQLGTDAANDTLVANSGNIMSVGGTVRPGHYVTFLNALEGVTNKQWTVRG